MSKIYPISSGKGGVGKSFIAVSLGVLLAKRGKKVVLVDLDLAGQTFILCWGLKTRRAELTVF